MVSERVAEVEAPKQGFEPRIPKELVFETSAIPDYAILALFIRFMLLFDCLYVFSIHYCGYEVVSELQNVFLEFEMKEILDWTMRP